MKAHVYKIFSVLVLFLSLGLGAGVYLLKPELIVPQAAVSSDYSPNSCMPGDAPSLMKVQGPLAANPVTNTQLPVPANLRVVGDDRRARLVWDDGGAVPVTAWNAAAYANDVRMGYYVEVVDKETRALVKESVTVNREMDIQPLTNGREYEAKVYSVDGFGRVSMPSTPVIMRPDGTKVDRLRAFCTGFFDDFNLAAGPFDELKWNFGVGINQGEKHNGAFINAQFHAHTSASSEESESDAYNDRTRVFSRPRAQFDITNRTGRIMFDLDGARGGRDIWYLDLYPGAFHNGRLDANGREEAFPPAVGEATRAYPGNFVRISNMGQSLSVEIYGQGGRYMGGFSTSAKEYQSTPNRSFAKNDFIPNVQRHWEIAVSRARMDIYIDGHWMLGGPLNLGAEFNRVQLGWVIFSYNTAKDNENRVQLAHWDNFCFDGPKVSTDVIHNYKYGNTSVGGADRIAGNGQTINLNIPDSIAGAKTAYLNFVLHPRGFSSYAGWNANQNVTVNGTRINFPDPYQTYLALGMQPLPSGGRDYSEFIGGNMQFPVQMAIPLSLLRQGNNSLQFNIPVSINNIHVELDFAAGTAPAYTQPAVVNNQAYTPKFWDHGPRTQFVSINNMTTFTPIANHQQTDPYRFINFTYRWDGGGGAEVPMRTGVNEILVRADLEPMLIGTGSNPGLYEARLLIDGQVVQTVALQAAVPAPMSYIRFNPDLTRFNDGQQHKFSVQVFSAQVNPATGTRYEGYGGSPDGFGEHAGIGNVANYGAQNPAFTFRVR